MWKRILTVLACAAVFMAMTIVGRVIEPGTVPMHRLESVVTHVDIGKLLLVSSKHCPPEQDQAGKRTRLRYACQVRHDYVGLHTKALPASDYGRITITGLNPKPGHRNRWVATLRITHAPPVIHPASPDDVPASNPQCPIHKKCWWDPTSWNWQHIFGHYFWDSFFEPCATGVEHGFVGAFGGVTIVNLIGYAGAFSTAALEVTPWGLFGGAIVGCVVGIFSH